MQAFTVTIEPHRHSSESSKTVVLDIGDTDELAYEATAVVLETIHGVELADILEAKEQILDAINKIGPNPSTFTIAGTTIGLWSGDKPNNQLTIAPMTEEGQIVHPELRHLTIRPYAPSATIAAKLETLSKEQLIGMLLRVHTTHYGNLPWLPGTV